MRKVTSEDKDMALLKAFRKGDQQAFGWLFERHRDGLISYAWRMTGREDVAYDICLETFAGLVVGVWRPQKPFKVSLLRVAHRMSLAAIRHQGKTPAPKTAFGPAEPGTPEGAAFDDGERAELERGLSQLAETYRAVLLLYYSQNLRADAVAAVLDVEESQVKRLLVQARTGLFEFLPGAS